NGSVTSLYVVSDQVVAVTDAGEVVGLDPASGQEIGRVTLPGAADVAGVDGGQRLVIDMSQLTTLDPFVSRLAEITGDDVNQLRAKLAGQTGKVVVKGYMGDSQLSQKLEDAGLTAASIQQGQALAIANEEGVSFIDAQTFDPLATVSTDSP